MALKAGWEVEWCTHIPLIPGTQDGDLDMATYMRSDFADKAAALAFAAKVFQEDKFGCVRVSQFEMVAWEPGWPKTRREYIGEPEYVDE